MTRGAALFARFLPLIVLAGCATRAIPCDALSDGGRGALAERPGSYCIGEEPGMNTTTVNLTVSALDHEHHVRKLPDIEREMIGLAVTFYEGDRKQAAQRLGMSLTTLNKRIKSYQAAVQP